MDETPKKRTPAESREGRINRRKARKTERKDRCERLGLMKPNPPARIVHTNVNAPSAKAVRIPVKHARSEAHKATNRAKNLKQKARKAEVAAKAVAAA